MHTHELVMRKNGTTYFRRIPKGRTFEEASLNRKKAIHQFTKAAISGRSKNYEEYIEHMRQNIQPVGRTPHLREIELSDEDIANVRDRLLRENMDSVELPENHLLKFPAAMAIVDDLKIEQAITQTLRI